ncbi:hypothetical protein L2E82_16041 [Cichorium intybus]|uniref:Uncharacterized protein n=1 Tax=Cichorium intybus TaxID=13427 RepID=A0ACB9F4H7_CICIN|nr:hypothetical protein L2E82_16041 [Cichorium intybus]
MALAVVVVVVMAVVVAVDSVGLQWMVTLVVGGGNGDFSFDVSAFPSQLPPLQSPLKRKSASSRILCSRYRNGDSGDSDDGCGFIGERRGLFDQAYGETR